MCVKEVRGERAEVHESTSVGASPGTEAAAVGTGGGGGSRPRPRPGGSPGVGLATAACRRSPEALRQVVARGAV